LFLIFILFITIVNTYVIVLPLLPLLEIVFLGLKFDNAFPEFMSLYSELVYGETFDAQRFDADGQRDLLFLLKLFLGLVTFQLSVAKAEL
jgi:hypothetical protein